MIDGGRVRAVKFFTRLSERRHSNSGCDRGTDNFPGDYRCCRKKCYCQVLRGGHHPEEDTAGKTEIRKGAKAEVRPGDGAAGSVL